ncbi:MAG: hypothetical protein ACREAG_07955 [Nitrosopumilaceae archaeon]
MPTINLKKDEHIEEIHSRYVFEGDTKKERASTPQTSEIVSMDENFHTTTNTPTVIYKTTELNESTTA